MKVEFRKSFEKDLGKLRDEDLLVKVKTVSIYLEVTSESVEILGLWGFVCRCFRFRRREIAFALNNPDPEDATQSHPTDRGHLILLILLVLHHRSQQYQLPTIHHGCRIAAIG
jgi:hypothetical protein